MRSCRQSQALPALLVLFLTAPTAVAQTPVADAGGVFGPGIFATFERPFAAHGVGGDQQVVFVLEALFEPQVHVLHRSTRHRLGSLPEPEGGLRLPMYVRVRHVEPLGSFGTRGEIVLLDAAPLDQQGVAPSYFHVYRYRYELWRGFSAELVQSHPVPLNTNPPPNPQNGLLFPSSFDLLPDGNIVVVDLFALWVANADFTDWRPALVSPEFAPAPYCSTVVVDGQHTPGFYVAVRDRWWRKVRVPYQLSVPAPEPFLPALKGATYIELTDEVAFIKVGSPGGIFVIDRQSLVDPTIPPATKTYRRLVTPEVGLSDLAGDVIYDRYHPDSEWVYWQRTASEPGQDQCAGAHPYAEKWSPIYRANVLTGAVELVAESWLLYDFPTVLSVLPPIAAHSRFTYLLSSNVMEERIAETNSLADATELIGPTIVPMVLVDAYSASAR